MNNKPHQAYEDMQNDWKLVKALNGGTSAMRDAKTDFLPKEPRESEAAYGVRLCRSFLFSGYSSTLKMLSSKPFQKNIITSEKLSDDINNIIADFDACGSNLTKFSKDVFKDAIDSGLSHMLIDMPSRDTDKNIDKASQAEQGIRPYAVHIKAEQVINWTSELRKGRHVLLSVTIKSKAWRNDGNTQAPVFVYTIYKENEVEIYEASKENEQPKLVDSFSHTLGKVPLVTVYANKTGFMTGKPAMLDLAYTNLAHWQSSSDQRNILKIANVPLIFASGFSTERGYDSKGNEQKGSSEIEMLGTISANSLIYSANEKAKLMFVEHSGAGIAAGERNLATLKEEMAIQGASFIVPKKGEMTATEYKGNASAIQSELQSIVANFEDSLNEAFNLIGDWLNTEIDAEISIFKEFNLNLDDANSLNTLMAMRKEREITSLTFRTECKRRGVFPDGFDVQGEVANVEQEDEMINNSFGDVNG